MILSILQHTPLWVFAVFAALVVLGVGRLRAREIPPRRLLLLPAAMTAFSLFGLVQGPGASAGTVGAWAVAFAAIVVVATTLPHPAGVQYSAATWTVRVPGSWLPLVLMMIVFFLRYAVAVVLAMHAGLRGDPAFAAGVAALYGAMSGIFAARALRTWRGAFAGGRRPVAA